MVNAEIGERSVSMILDDCHDFRLTGPAFVAAFKAAGLESVRFRKRVEFWLELALYAAIVGAVAFGTIAGRVG